MQDVNEIQKIRLERLTLRLAEVEAERERVNEQMQALSLSLTKHTSTGLWRRARIAATGILAVVSLLATDAFHYAQSSVNENDPRAVTAMSPLQTGNVALGELPSASGITPSALFSEEQTTIARTKIVSQRQWGPLLVMPEPAVTRHYYGFDPMVKKQQENLLTLGFDLGEADGFKGPRTQQSIAEFRALYLPENAKQLQVADIAVIMEAYAKLARNDAARFGIDTGIVAAIRLSSVRTNVDFTYLMKLAATESNFEPESEAPNSSATGMYQFTHDTWLNAIKRYGKRYGFLADYAAKIKYNVTPNGYQRPTMQDNSMYQHLLALRKNPRISAMMAAETVRDSQRNLVSVFDREPTQTDLYLTHFLGTSAAITFLRSLEQSPGTPAVEIFPRAASSNYNIFHPKSCGPRTVDEVYAFLEEKFSTHRYE